MIAFHWEPEGEWIDVGRFIDEIPQEPTALARLRARALADPLYRRTLVSDEGARFDREVGIDAAALKPQVTWGTSPEMVVSIEDRVPDPAAEKDPVRREAMERALEYMGLDPRTPMTDIAIDKVFIGSVRNFLGAFSPKP